MYGKEWHYPVLCTGAGSNWALSTIVGSIQGGQRAPQWALTRVGAVRPGSWLEAWVALPLDQHVHDCDNCHQVVIMVVKENDNDDDLSEKSVGVKEAHHQ